MIDFQHIRVSIAFNSQENSDNLKSELKAKQVRRDNHEVNSNRGSASRLRVVITRAGFMMLKLGSKVAVGSFKRVD